MIIYAATYYFRVFAIVDAAIICFRHAYADAAR